MKMDGSSYAERLNDRDAVMKELEAGIRAAVRMHKFLGNPVAAFRDGKVVWIAPEDIRPNGTYEFPDEVK